MLKEEDRATVIGNIQNKYGGVNMQLEICPQTDRHKLTDILITIFFSPMRVE